MPMSTRSVLTDFTEAGGNVSKTVVAPEKRGVVGGLLAQPRARLAGGNFRAAPPLLRALLPQSGVSSHPALAVLPRRSPRKHSLGRDEAEEGPPAAKRARGGAASAASARMTSILESRGSNRAQQMVAAAQVCRDGCAFSSSGPPFAFLLSSRSLALSFRPFHHFSHLGRFHFRRNCEEEQSLNRRASLPPPRKLLMYKLRQAPPP